MGGHASQEKTDLRRRYLAERRRRARADVAADSRAVYTCVVRTRLFSSARHLVAYAALPGEIDPSPIVDAGLAAEKTVYFPRLREGRLEFLAALPSALRPGAFAIPEPLEGVPLRDESSTLFLVPGVAFDSSGARLGRGGGHYDRALAVHASGFRLGLAADRQLAARLPHDDWDEPMDGVITEQRMLWSAARPRLCPNKEIER